MGADTDGVVLYLYSYLCKAESSSKWLILIVTYFIPVVIRITSHSVFRKRASCVLLMKLTPEMKTYRQPALKFKL